MKYYFGIFFLLLGTVNAYNGKCADGQYSKIRRIDTGDSGEKFRAEACAYYGQLLSQDEYDSSDPPTNDFEEHTNCGNPYNKWTGGCYVTDKSDTVGWSPPYGDYGYNHCGGVHGGDCYSNSKPSCLWVDCEDCPVGTYNPAVGTEGWDPLQCTMCPTGKYQSEEGKTSCEEGVEGMPDAWIHTTTLTNFDQKVPASDRGIDTYESWTVVTQVVRTGWGAPLPCGTTEYMDVSNDYTCTNCDAGSELSGTVIIEDVTHRNGCDECSTGRFSTASNIGCEECPAGKFQAEEGKSECDPCDKTGATLYNNEIGLHDNNHCVATQCQAGYKLDGTVCEQCGKGTFSDTVGTSCSPCTGNEFQPDIGQTSCDTCAANKIVTNTDGISGFDGCDDCLLGHETQDSDNNPVATGGTQCVQCPAGKYDNDLVSGTACETCDPGSETHKDGARVTEGATECVPCDPGSYAGSSTNGVCTPCPDKTFAATAGKASCDPCGIGREPQLNGVLTTSGATHCIGCDAGTYKDDTTDGICVDCGDRTFSGEGQASCTPCADGSETHLNGILVTSGATHCVGCDPGSYADSSTDHTCTPCPEGTFTGQIGNPSCTTCDDGRETQINGTLVTSGATSCEACDAGWYSNSGTAGVCTLCPHGSVTNTLENIGGTSCTPCDSGLYDDDQDSTTVCVPCGAGNVVYNVVDNVYNAMGTCVGTSADDGGCIMTSGGLYCVPCKSGTVTNDAVTACAACEDGKETRIIDNGNEVFHASDGASHCSPCDAGKYDEDGLANTECIACDNGHETQTADGTQVNSGATDCEICPIGNNDFDSDSSTACVPCEAGKFAITTGKTSCDVCEPGYNTIDGNGDVVDSGAEACIMCEIGSYSTDPIVECIKCSRETYQDEEGKTSCKVCDNGHETNFAQSCIICERGSTSCHHCVAGEYDHDMDSASGCKGCPAFTFNLEDKLTTCTDMEMTLESECQGGTYTAGIPTADSTCVEIDECATIAPCHPAGTVSCNNEQFITPTYGSTSIHGYTCTCKENWENIPSEENCGNIIDDCAHDNSAGHIACGGMCTNRDKVSGAAFEDAPDYVCVCDDGNIDLIPDNTGTYDDSVTEARCHQYGLDNDEFTVGGTFEAYSGTADTQPNYPKGCYAYISGSTKQIHWNVGGKEACDEAQSGFFCMKYNPDIYGKGTLVSERCEPDSCVAGSRVDPNYMGAPIANGEMGACAQAHNHGTGVCTISCNTGFKVDVTTGYNNGDDLCHMGGWSGNARGNNIYSLAQCIECESYHYSDAIEGNKVCAEWTTCGPGFYKTSHDEHSDGECTPCPDGFFCPGGDQNDPSNVGYRFACPAGMEGTGIKKTSQGKGCATCMDGFVGHSYVTETRVDFGDKSFSVQECDTYSGAVPFTEIRTLNKPLGCFKDTDDEFYYNTQHTFIECADVQFCIKKVEKDGEDECTECPYGRYEINGVCTLWSFAGQEECVLGSAFVAGHASQDSTCLSDFEYRQRDPSDKSLDLSYESRACGDTQYALLNPVGDIICTDCNLRFFLNNYRSPMVSSDVSLKRGSCCVNTHHHVCITMMEEYQKKCGKSNGKQRYDTCSTLITINFDGDYYKLCPGDPAPTVAWNGLHNIQEVVRDGYVYEYDTSHNIGSEIIGLQPFGTMTNVNGLASTPGNHRYFLCSYHPTNKFMTYCPSN